MNRKHTLKLTESELKSVITESIRRVMSEGGVSLSNYDNQEVRRNLMNSDAPWEQDGGYLDDTPVNMPEYDEREECWNTLLSWNHRGIISDDELDKIRDILGF